MSASTAETLLHFVVLLACGCIVASICRDWLDEFIAWRHSNPHFGRLSHLLAVWAGRGNRKDG